MYTEPSRTKTLELLDLWALLESVAREKFATESQSKVDELVHAAVETALGHGQA